jgi:hypothetical protein
MALQWRRLFNITQTGSLIAGTRAAADETERQGAFVTPQSIGSFAGASFVVGLVWQMSGYIDPAWSGSNIVGLIVSLAVAGFLLFASATDPARNRLTLRDWVIESVVAGINSLVLFSAALGGSTAIAGQ